MNKKLKNLIGILVAIILAGSIIIGIVGIVRMNLPEPTPEEQIEEATGGGLVSPDELESNGIKFTATAIPVELYSEYGIATIAESALQLTVTPTPAEADMSSGKFAIKFKNASSEWANGKTLSEYGTLQTVDTTHANFTCLKAFGEQIIVEYSVTGEKDGQFTTLTAEYPLDYAKRITNLTGAFSVGSSFGSSLRTDQKPTYTNTTEPSGYNCIALKKAYDQTTNWNITFTPSFSDGTVSDAPTLKNISFKFTDGFKGIVESKGTLPTFTPSVTASNGYTLTFPANTIKSMFGSNIQNGNITSAVISTFAQCANVNSTRATGVFQLTFDAVGTYSTYNASFLIGVAYGGYTSVAQSIDWEGGAGHIF